MRYSAFSLLKNALSGHRRWRPVWRTPEPKPGYDVIIVGGGGHGLATAYYLASLNHGITRRIAVLEKGWLGGGNTGRNTTIVRSELPAPRVNEPTSMEFSLQALGGPGARRSTSTPWSRSGAYSICIHSDAVSATTSSRRGNAMRLARHRRRAARSRTASRASAPLNLDFDNARFPIRGGLLQPRGGTVRHDAVAWGYARGADSRGVDIIQNCEVTGFTDRRWRVHRGRDHPRRDRRRQGRDLGRRLTPGHVIAQAGLRLPIETHVLQAFVSEGLKPTARRGGHLRRRVISTSASPTRAAWCSAVTSTATTPTPSAATCRSSRTLSRRRHGDHANDRPRTPDAHVGRRHGHVDGRLTVSSIRTDGLRSLPQRRLVLRRFQGDAGGRLDCYAHHPRPRLHRPTRSLTALCALDRFERGAHHRREAGVGAQPLTSTDPTPTCEQQSPKMIINHPLLRPARCRRVRLSAATPRPDSPGLIRRRTDASAGSSTTTSTSATTRPGSIESCGITRAGVTVQLAGRHPRYTAPTRSPSRRARPSVSLAAADGKVVEPAHDPAAGTAQPQRAARRACRPRAANACAFTFDGQGLSGASRRHAGLRAARQRRPPGRPLVQVPPAARPALAPVRRSRTRWSRCAAAPGGAKHCGRPQSSSLSTASRPPRRTAGRPSASMPWRQRRPARAALLPSRLLLQDLHVAKIVLGEGLRAR